MLEMSLSLTLKQTFISKLIYNINDYLYSTIYLLYLLFLDNSSIILQVIEILIFFFLFQLSFRDQQ